MNGRFQRLLRRVGHEVVEAWQDSNRASALMRERQQFWRTAAPLHWIDTANGPRLVGSRLPRSNPQPGH
jgi:hypothetical protein